MALKLSPLTLKFHNLAVVRAPISRVFFPPSNALARAQSSSFQLLRCDVKSDEAKENPDMESWRCNVKSSESEGNLGMESSIHDEQTLQDNLKKAIEEEDYARAAEFRDSLKSLEKDSKASVLAANSRFYDGFRNGDLAAMQSIWAERNNVYVVHPGKVRISYHELVIQSWKFIFRAKHEFPILIELKNVKVYVKGNVGYVTCMEIMKNEGNLRGIWVATNVFERIDGKWYMCIHHVSDIDP